MSWSDPSGHVWAVGEVLSASNMNTYIKDNLLDLDRRVTITSAVVATAESTASTSYTNLATTGPAITFTIGGTGAIEVNLSSTLYNNTANDGAMMAYAISGATTSAATDVYALYVNLITANAGGQFGVSQTRTGLTSGSNTLTAKYRAVAAGTANYSNRQLSAQPVGS